MFEMGHRTMNNIDFF